MLNLSDQLYTIFEAAQKLGVSTKTLRRWEQDGRVTPRRTVGGQRRYTSAEIEQLKNNDVKQTLVENPINGSDEKFSQFNSCHSDPPAGGEESLANARFISNNLSDPLSPAFGKILKMTNKFKISKLSPTNLVLTSALLGFIVFFTIPTVFAAGKIIREYVSTITAYERAKDAGNLTLLPISSASPEESSSLTVSPSVLGTQTVSPDFVFNVNVPAYFNENTTFNEKTVFTKDVELKGNIIGTNIVNSVKAGTGISVDGGQNPTITNTGVTKLGGKTGDLALEAGTGITVDGLKITNSGITSLTAGTGIAVSGSTISTSLTAGTGISLSGATITNSDTGSAQYIFKNIAVSGQNTVAADANADTLTLANGNGITITTDSTNQKLTIAADGAALNVSGWTRNSTNGYVYLSTTTDKVGIGTTAPQYALDVSGSGYFSGNLIVAGGLTTTSGINNQGGGITNAGAITGATGLTSSGTITFSAFGTGLLHSNASGVLSSSAVSLTSADVSGTLPTTRGGVGLSSYTTGDMIYSSAADTFSKLAIGSSGQVLTVSGGIPSWGTVQGGSGGLCTDCIVTDPGSTQTILPTASTATGLSIKQASSGSVDIFNVTNYAGTTKYFKVDSSGNTTIAGATLSVAPSGTDPLSISPATAGETAYTGTLTSATLTNNRTWTFPDGSGIVCTSAGNCNGLGTNLSGSGTNNYVARFNGTYGLENSNLYDNGNIGIGTTSPSYKMDVAGTLRATGATTLSSTLGVTGATTLSDTLQVTNGATLLSTLNVTGATTLSSTLDVTGGGTFGGNLHVNGTGNSYVMGNVGIGTTSPASPLEVVGALTIQGSGGITNAGEIWSHTSGTNYPQAKIRFIRTNSPANVDTAIAFETLGSGVRAERMRIDTTGNVGIGTTGPTKKLEISGGDIYLSSTNKYIYFERQGSVQHYIGDRNDHLLLGAGGSGNIYLRSGNNDFVLAGNGGISVGTGYASTLPPSNGTIIQGNVGIGTTSPTAKLDVNGGILGSTFNGLTITSSTGTLTIPNGKTISFADSFTTSGAFPLTLTTTASTNVTLPTTGTLATLAGTETLSGKTFSGSTYFPGSGIWDTSGNIGIGTTSPSALLQISSSSTGINLLDILSSSSSVFTVSDTQISANLPASFNSPGDIASAYDLVFTNPTAGYIKSQSPLAIESGEVYNSDTLTLRVYNQGTVVVDASQQTTGNGMEILASALTSGSALNITPTFNGSAVTGYGIYQSGSDATANANTDYGLYNLLTLTGNAAKSGIGAYSAVTSASTTADTLTGISLAPSASGAISTGTRTIYGMLNQPASTGAASGGTLNLYGNYINPSSTLATAGTTNVYGSYLTSTATHAADAGTINQYGLYIANGTSSTNGTSTKTGLYVEAPTGADTNYAAIFAGGNVGIGTTAPTAGLDVQVNNALVGNFKNTTTTTAARIQIGNNGVTSLGNESSTGGGIFGGTAAYSSVFGNQSASSLHLATNNAARLTIDSGGNVGIGTTGPSQKLDVYGNINLGDASNDSLMFQNSYVMIHRAVNTLQFTANNGWTFYDAQDVDGGERVRITKEGNVGIGTTSPSQKMEIAGQLKLNTTYGVSIGDMADVTRMVGYPTGTTIRFINSSNGYANLGFGNLSVGSGYAATSAPTSGAIIEGNVGIGTTSPTAALTVNGAITTLGQANITGGNITANNTTLIAGSGRSNYITITSQSTTNAVIAGTNSGIDFTSMNNGNINLLPNGTGSVGIGTTSPGAQLEIASTLGSELAPALADPNWTLGTGWATPISGGVLQKNVDGTGTAVPASAITTTAWTTYKVIVTVSSMTAGTLNTNLGNVFGQTISSAGTYTMYMQANENANLTFYPSNTSRFTVSAVSVKAMSNGGVNVYGSLALASPIVDMLGENVLSTMSYAGTAHIGIAGYAPQPGYALSTNGGIYTNSLYGTSVSGSTLNFNTIKDYSGNNVSFTNTGNTTFAGNVGIGSTAPGYKLQVGEAGDGSEARANAWNALSDARFKTNIRSLSNLSTLDKILQLEGISYDWKSNGKTGLGFIAQDVEKIFPELVSTDKDGILSLNYSGLTAPIVESIKLQQNQIASLSAELKTTKLALSDVSTQTPTPTPTIPSSPSPSPSPSNLVSQIVEFLQNVIFHADVTFLARTTYNSDTAGFAVVRKGERKVDVVFDKEYPEIPVVTASLLWDIDKGTTDQIDKLAGFFLPTEKYAVASLSTKGFTVVLDDNAISDLKFSWTAISVKGAKTVNAPTPTPTPEASPSATLTATPTPTPSQTATPTPSTTPTATPSATPSATPTITVLETATENATTAQ